MQAGGLFGKFLIESPLGRGGSGEVWKAIDTELSRPVAIKFPHGDDPDELARFLREARLAGGLAHPNIAGIHEVIEVDGRPAIVMQFVDGGTLRSRIGGERRELVRMMRDAALAVEHAHAHGVVHRDLKPDNLMVDRSGHVFVTDFGLARTSESRLSSTGTVVGTPAYMAPEQARGEPCTARSDIYSLGATLYELVGGRPAFGRATVMETLRQIQEEDAAPLRGIDAELEAVIFTCLEKAPMERYATAKAFARDLERWLAGEPVQAHRPSLTARVGRLARRRPMLAVAAVATLLLVAGFAVALPGFQRGTDDTRRALTERMRERAATCLEAVLDQRRAGNLDGMKRYADELRGACADVIRVSPDAPEPYYQLGRLERALLNFDDAYRRQSEALARDPAHLGARYERAVAGNVTAAMRLAEELDRLLRDAGAAAMALDGRLRAGTLPDRAAIRARADADPRVRELRSALIDDLARLEDRRGELDPARRSFVKGLSAALAGDAATARQELRNAVSLEEGIEALALAVPDDEAIGLWTRGISQDAGYLPFLEGRARSRLHVLRRQQVVDQEGEWRLVVADLRASLARKPGRVLVELQLASALSEYGQWLHLRGLEAGEPSRAAIDVLDAVVRRSPSGDVFAMRSLCRLQLAGLGRSDADEQFAAALADADEALRSAVPPKDAWPRRGCVHFNWAQQRRARGSPSEDFYRKSIEDYSEALRIDPTDATVWAQRGHARGGFAVARFSAGGDATELFRTALEDLDEAVRRSSNPADSLERRGLLRANRAFTIASSQGDARADFLSAMTDLDEAVRRAPGAIETLVSRGHTLLTWAQAEREAGRPADTLFRRAIADFDAILSAAPTLDDVRHYRGIALTGLGLVELEAGGGSKRFDEGLAELDAAVLRRPGLYERRLSRGKARADRGFLEQQRGAEAQTWFTRALEDIDEALKLNEGHAEAWLSRAKLRMNLGVIEGHAGRDALEWLRRAREDADEGVRRLGATPAALELRGLLKLNEAAFGGASPEALYREAVEDLSKALEKNPAMPSSLLGLGSAHYILGQVLKKAEHLDAALKAFDRLLALGLRQADAYYRRGLIRKEQAEQALAAQRDAVPLLEAAAADFGRSFQVAPNLEIKVEEGVCWHNAARLRKTEARAAYAKALACYEEAVKLVPAARERLAEHIEDARKGAE